jgi:uncharacterized protein (TIGR03067 family)
MKLAAAFLLLFAGVASGDDKANEKLLSDLAGSYSVVTIEKAGEAPPPEFLKSFQKVTIKANKLTMTFKEESKMEEHSALLTVDASKKPPHVDFKPSDGPKKDEVKQGIVEIASDTVKISWNDASGKRPIDATSTKDNKNFVITLKRIKE